MPSGIYERRTKHGRGKMFDEATELEIVRVRREGTSAADIAIQMGCSEPLIYAVLRKHAPELIRQRTSAPTHRLSPCRLARKAVPAAVKHAPAASLPVAPVTPESVIRYQLTKAQLMAGSARVHAGIIY